VRVYPGVKPVVVLLLLSILLVSGQLTPACFSPADSYAVEVVLNKPGVTYNLTRLKELVRELKEKGGKPAAYVYRSSLDDRLLVVVSEQEVPMEGRRSGDGEYLAVRIQVPVKELGTTVHICSLTVEPSELSSKNASSAEIGVASLERLIHVSGGIGEYEGSLGTISVSDTGLVQFKPSVVFTPAEPTIVMGGFLTLASGYKVYRVAMPCIASIGEPCYRILTLIPGYDAPMQLEAGVYNVTLHLEWNSSEEAECLFKVDVIQSTPHPWRTHAEKTVGNAKLAVDVSLAGGDAVVTWRVEGAGGLDTLIIEELKEITESSGLNASLVDSCSFEKYYVSTGYAPAYSIGEDEVRDALRAELEWMIDNGVIAGLTRSDLEGIAASARLGYAGWNSRLVWDGNGWVTYSSVQGAVQVRCFVAPDPDFLTAATPGPPAGEEAGAEAPAPLLSWPLMLVSILIAALAAAASYIVTKKRIVPAK